MKLTLFAAISANGMIADKNGSEEFLPDSNWEIFKKLTEEKGCLVVGRKAYEAVQKYPDYNFSNINAKLKIIVSSDKNFKPDSSFLLSISPEEAIKKISEENLEEAILAGGGMINSSFLEKNLIDEIILAINPVVVADGIPVFAKNNLEKKLSLIEFSKIDNDIILAKYKILK